MSVITSAALQGGSINYLFHSIVVQEISPSLLRPSSSAIPHSPLDCTCSVISCDINEEPLFYTATLWRFSGLCYLSSQRQKSLGNIASRRFKSCSQSFLSFLHLPRANLDLVPLRCKKGVKL